jgi:hypothetical protein
MLNWATIRRRMFLRFFQWFISLRYVSGLQKFLAGAAVLIISGIPLWRRFGTETSLPILADATPILLAVVGVVMSYIQPKKESHLITTVILITAGLAGSIVLSVNRLHSEAAHRIEVGTLSSKIDAVGSQNANLANFLLKAKDSGTLSEADRRRGIELTLRSEYILKHDPVDPDILVGNKMPPAGWMNQRLHDLGENWTVAKETHTIASASGARSYITLESPVFAGGKAEGENFQPGEAFAFNVHFQVTGPNSVQSLGVEQVLLVEPDFSAETQKAAIASFLQEDEKERKQLGPPVPDTMMPGDRRFFSVVAKKGEMGPNGTFWIVDQDDLDKLKAGTEIAFFMTIIPYKDGGVIHHLRRCLFLQPPAQPPGIWHFCEGFQDSD